MSQERSTTQGRELALFVMRLVSHAADRGQGEAQIYRFPNAIWSDRGRRNQQLGARLGNDAGGPPQFRLRILA